MFRLVPSKQRFFSRSKTLFVNSCRCDDVFLPKRLHSETMGAAASQKSALFRDLSSRILACGPITVADYMKEVLTNPREGYYMTKDVFGTKGDFITSPEITQMFGEMIGIWIVSQWQKMTQEQFQLVELGPGRGTLAKDILRVFKQLKVNAKVSLHLVEVSPVLSAIQAEKLCVSSKSKTPVDNENATLHYREGKTADGVDVYWYHGVKDVPRGFSVFVAHEFFDAMPIHIFQKDKLGWSEVLVDIDPLAKDEEKFRFVISRSPTVASLTYIDKDEKRDHVEISPDTLVIVDYLSTFLEENGGFALIADYGHNGDKTDTFRGFCKHALHDPLKNPGKADLTADVDFAMVKRIAEKKNRVVTFGPVTQGNFLRQLGIDVRLEMLLNGASEQEKDRIRSGYHMITDDDQMGQRFKLLSMFPYVLRDHLEKWPVEGFQVVHGVNIRPC